MNAPARRPGPFELHLVEAIELNRSRAPRYADLTNGASWPISRALMLSERLLLPVARWFDRRAEPYHAAGVPLLEDAFVSMAETPEFLDYRAPIPPQPRLRPDSRRIARASSGAWRADGLPGLCALLEGELKVLSGEPSYHCMLRHLLESTLRLAMLAPLHARQSIDTGMRSSVGISRQMVRLHLWGLRSAIRMDRRAMPLQQRGIAIIAQDVPPIPIPE
ncbi:hypothetical protein BH23GEM6_BH23GEM6_18770 [soil metagenome]